MAKRMRWLERLHGDVVFFRGMVRALRRATPLAKHPTRVFPGVVDELAERYGQRVALISDRETFTYCELGERSNRYARWARAQALAKGEVVCLLMPNRPEYLAIWIGITGAGGVVALLNTHLSGPSLAYCIDIVEPRHVIVASELVDALATAEPHLTSRARIWVHGESARPFPRIDREIERFDGTRLASSERPALTVEDRALYIYTSGTTGMPKAANVNHYRIMLAAFGFAGVMGTRASDRMYDCLPMYHTTGGLIATCALLVVGGSVVIRERFSAGVFWAEVVRHGCTMFQYIGELCRYLVHTPPGESERRHRLRLVCGNGLRPDVWSEFKARFRIPLVLEFYAATEGNVTLFNFEGKQGAVGRIPWFIARRFPIVLVRFDVEAAAPVRDNKGFCIPCRPGEIGEVIGRIVRDPAKPSSRFEGYADPAEDEKKILRGAFEAGDAWFRTGDLMRQDADGYFYFVDRIGDTFRWKGENVSTTEVTESVNSFPGVRETSVCGVPVPGCEGRAGMAAIVCNDDLDLVALHAHLAARLPSYARPLFLRISSHLEVTATFKQRKIELAQAGFDPSLTDDAIYFDDPVCGAYLPLTPELFQRIQAGEAAMSRAETSLAHGAADVLGFWRAAGPKRWFTADEAFDAGIRGRFLATYEAAAAGRLASWQSTPEQSLALLIVLDQFPRNMFRGTARAYAADKDARAAAERALARGYDRTFANPERRFFYLPFMHSENIVDQERCVALCRAAGDAEGLDHAHVHADIIRRFGRFPHRNAALGRTSTAEEKEFLAGGGFSG